MGDGRDAGINPRGNADRGIQARGLGNRGVEPEKLPAHKGMPKDQVRDLRSGPQKAIKKEYQLSPPEIEQQICDQRLRSAYEAEIRRGAIAYLVKLLLGVGQTTDLETMKRDQASLFLLNKALMYQEGKR
jgi:hypothetical protein